METINIPEPQHPTRATKVINKFILLALLTIGVALAIILNWSLTSTEVLQVKNSPFPTKIIQSADGESVLVLDTEYCKTKRIGGRLRVSFVSPTREVFLPIVEEHLQPGCHKQDIPIIIPAELPDDTYKVKFRATYNINPLKKDVPVEFESRSVTIQR